MKIAIISDIHSNLVALLSVFEEIEKQQCDKIVCMGDMVGYGPHPNECLELIRSRADIVLAGNHDLAALGALDMRNFNRYAREMAIWTGGILSEEHKKYLQSLPIMMSEEDIYFVHATPCEPDQWHYLVDLNQAKKNFACFSEHVCFVGHSHIPVLFEQKDNHVSLKKNDALPLDAACRYLINVGSVGQPRDNDPRAAFAIFDTNGFAYNLLRIEYDVPAVQKQMKSKGFPAFLIERLHAGR